MARPEHVPVNLADSSTGAESAAHPQLEAAALAGRCAVEGASQPLDADAIPSLIEQALLWPP